MLTDVTWPGVNSGKNDCQSFSRSSEIENRRDRYEPVQIPWSRWVGDDNYQLFNHIFHHEILSRIQSDRWKSQSSANMCKSRLISSTRVIGRATRRKVKVARGVMAPSGNRCGRSTNVHGPRDGSQTETRTHAGSLSFSRLSSHLCFAFILSSPPCSTVEIASPRSSRRNATWRKEPSFLSFFQLYTQQQQHTSHSTTTRPVWSSTQQLELQFLLHTTTTISCRYFLNSEGNLS